MKKILFGLISLGILTNASAGWTVKIDKDEMTGEKFCFAVSDFVGATKQLRFPYGDLKQAIVVRVDEEDEKIAYLQFTGNPNLTDIKLIKESGTLATRKVKFDNKIEEIDFVQQHGESSIFVSDRASFLSNLMDSKELLTSQEQYGNNTVYYKHNLKEFRKIYNQARKKCGLKNEIVGLEILLDIYKDDDILSILKKLEKEEEDDLKAFYNESKVKLEKYIEEKTKTNTKQRIVKRAKEIIKIYENKSE